MRRVRHGGRVCGYDGLAASGGVGAAHALMRAGHRSSVCLRAGAEVYRFARSVSHVLRALEASNHLRVRFMSVQDQLDTAGPRGKAMFTIIGRWRNRSPR